jgi:hypothetical protein
MVEFAPALLAQQLGELGRDDARDDVVRTAGRKADDQAYRFGRVLLRTHIGGARSQQQRQNASI